MLTEAAAAEAEKRICGFSISRSAGMKLRDIWRGSYSRYALGMSDLFISNNGVFVFLRTRNPSCTSPPDRSPPQAGDVRSLGMCGSHALWGGTVVSIETLTTGAHSWRPCRQGGAIRTGTPWYNTHAIVQATAEGHPVRKGLKVAIKDPLLTGAQEANAQCPTSNVY